MYCVDPSLLTDPWVVGDLVELGVAVYEVVAGEAGGLSVSGPVNGKADRGGLW